MDRVQQKKRPYALLVLSALSILTTLYIFLTFPPSSALNFWGLHISYVVIFFLLMFLFLYGIAAFFLRSALQGVLIASVVIAYFLFRLNNLSNPLFVILLVVLFGCLEVVFWRR